MSYLPSELKYARTHEWVRLEENGEIVVGITEHAQDLLGDMVFIELPTVGRKLDFGEECALVESVKAASDIYAPASGEVIKVNEELADSPELVNSDPYGDGWLFRLKLTDESDLNELLDASQYQDSIDDE